METFGTYTNNGLTAVAKIGDVKRALSGDKLKGWIYLFTRDEYLVKEHVWALKPWIHGGYGLMHQLLEGHFIEHTFISVPFSVGNYMMPAHQPYLLDEIEQIAPMHKLLETFGFELARVSAPVPAA